MNRSPASAGLALLCLLLLSSNPAPAQILAIAPRAPTAAARVSLAPPLAALAAPATPRPAASLSAAPIAAAAPAARAERPASPAAAGQDDVPGIMEIERTAFSRSDRWERRAWREAVDDPDGAVKVIRSAYRAAAAIYYALEGDDSLYVWSVAVHPDFRRRGYGEALMREAVAAAEGDRRVSAVSLHVRAGNAPAVALYEKLGFRVVERQPRYYPDGEDSLLMSRDVAR